MTPLKTKIQQIRAVIHAHKHLESACSKACKAGCLDIEGDLHKAIWASFDSLADLVDQSGWINWFIYDNRYGKRGLEATMHGETRKIRTVRQLAALMLEAEQ